MLKFLFVNFYAFVLLALAGALFFIPLNILIIILKFSIILFCIVGSINIFMQWEKKNRIINLLIKKNEKEFRISSFDPFMETLCSQLVVIYVLIKIGHLKKIRMIFRKWRSG